MRILGYVTAVTLAVARCCPDGGCVKSLPAYLKMRGV